MRIGRSLHHATFHASTPKLPFKTPPIPSDRDHKALKLNRGTLAGAGDHHPVTFPLAALCMLGLVSLTAMDSNSLENPAGVRKVGRGRGCIAANMLSRGFGHAIVPSR